MFIMVVGAKAVRDPGCDYFFAAGTAGVAELVDLQEPFRGSGGHVQDLGMRIPTRPTNLV